MAEGINTRIYRLVGGGSAGPALCKATLFVADRPGVLSELASLFGERGANIILFHYNRSEHPHRVVIEAEAETEDRLRMALSHIEDKGIHEASLEMPSLELSLTDPSSLLNIEVELEHKPGTLGRFASLLASHGANVIHMSYNQEVSATSARFSIATHDSAEVDILLKDMNEGGWHYSLLYRGAGKREIDDVIGLNLVEKFFFKLKDTLGTADVEKVKAMAGSSQKISEALMRFSREAGRDLEASSVFTSVLAFTSASVLKTGGNFSYTALPAVSAGDLRLHVFRLPTGGNTIVLETTSEDPELVMIDGGYGIYYEDVKQMLRENSLPPERIGRIYLSHADSDHAGMSGLFQKEFGSRVYMHKDADLVIKQGNRAAGSATRYLELNGLFTAVVDCFTEAAYPQKYELYTKGEGVKLGGFHVCDSFEVGGMDFLVLQSLGGHVPGQVFFISPDAGLMCTSDYLLNIESLSPEERDVLSVPRFMMVSTNVDSALFTQEMTMLKNLARDFSENRKGMLVVPGHGDSYMLNG